MSKSLKKFSLICEVKEKTTNMEHPSHTYKYTEYVALRQMIEHLANVFDESAKEGLCKDSDFNQILRIYKTLHKLFVKINTDVNENKKKLEDNENNQEQIIATQML